MSVPAIRTLTSRAPHAELRSLAAAASTDDPDLRQAVAGIIREVANRGDAALLEYTRRLDARTIQRTGALAPS